MKRAAAHWLDQWLPRPSCFRSGAPPCAGCATARCCLARVRLRLALLIRQRALCFAIGAASSREIDRLNIRVATALAMRRAIARVLLKSPLAACMPHRVLIDGLPLPEIGFDHEALVDGDARCHSIAAAAVLAKTVRDRLMQRLAPRYPGYGWDTNVGYGTEEHQVGLRIHGPTRHHRLTFAPLSQLSLFA